MASLELLGASDVKIKLGSTSIQGLWAKDCIDILGVVDNSSLGSNCIEPFKRLGYFYKGEYGISGRHYFSRAGKPKIHLHVLPLPHEQVAVHLHFKKVMSESPQLVNEFNDLKRALSSTLPKEIYQLKKKLCMTRSVQSRPNKFMISRYVKCAGGVRSSLFSTRY